MTLSNYQALRLGFNAKHAELIQKIGVEKYISQQINAKNQLIEPDFIKNSPKSIKELQQFKKEAEKDNDKFEKVVKQIYRTGIDWKAFLIQRMYETDFPLREKINLFFQNHFVSTYQSVKVPYWIYKQYETINNYSSGNYKTLVTEMVYSNAMIKYLDNQKNVKGKINENLARELLELFTLGEGNYTENDIKNTALALAGLNFGEEKGIYRNFFKDNSTKTILGKSGNFTIDEVIEIIFEQPNIANFLTEKLLKWFFYDEPTQEIITHYADYLRKQNFELKPFFQYFLSVECKKNNQGTQIKNPMQFLFQLFDDLNIDKPNYKVLVFFLKNQGMDIYDQPNVKGWKLGRNWLTSQLYLERNQLVDFLTDGNQQFLNRLNKRLERFEVGKIEFLPNLQLKNNQNAKAIINELTERTIFKTNDEMMTELNQLLKYDFDPNAENAKQKILNVYQYLAKTPEFQII